MRRVTKRHTKIQNNFVVVVKFKKYISVCVHNYSYGIIAGKSSLA